MKDKRDTLILMLAERLYICSSLLTKAAERLGWDDLYVRGLMQRLEDMVREETMDYASIEENE